MGFHDIEKKSIWYSFLLHIVVIPWHNIIFYRKIFINFRERIPKNDHVIFAPNHQNALLDALALLCNIDRQLVFLARSDIFKKKKIAGILYFLKILPVFRKRDGLRSVKNNMETFDKTAEVIQAKNGLVILPEGDFVRKHQLRPLKKGFARIAFQAGEANDFGLDIKIVPVGLHYSSFSELRCDLIINFGHPVAVSKYYDLYKSAPAVAINKLTNALKDALRQVMLELPDQDYEMFYDLIQISRARLDQLKIKPANDLKTEQETTSKLIRLQANDPAGYTLLKNAFQKFCNQLNLTSVNKETFIKSKAEPLILSLKSLGLLLGDPFLFICCNQQHGTVSYHRGFCQDDKGCSIPKFFPVCYFITGFSNAVYYSIYTRVRIYCMVVCHTLSCCFAIFMDIHRLFFQDKYPYGSRMGTIIS